MKVSYLQYKITELELLIRDECGGDDLMPEEVRAQIEVLHDIEDEIQVRKL